MPVIHVAGDVDLLTTRELKGHLAELLATEPQALVVDFGAVSFLAAVGLTVLGETAQSAAQHNAQLRLVATSRSVLRPLTITELDHTIPVHPSIHEALNYCTDPAT